jgi:hypothetical protein
MYYLGNHLVGFNPLYYHIVTLLLHTMNVLLVFKLAHILFNNKWISFAASLLFATFFMNYEVVYWVTGISYILLTIFYISTLLFFIRYLNEKKKKYYALFLTAFTLCIFTVEQGVSLLGACIILETLLPDNLRRLRLSSLKQKSFFLFKMASKYLLPLMVVASFIILKLSMQQRFVATRNTFQSFVKNIYGVIWHLFIPYPYGISNGTLFNTSKWDYRIFLFISIVVITSYFFIRHYRELGDISRDDKTTFSSDALTCFFLFSCILIYVIPQSVGTTIQARYFYLPSVFSAIILGSLFVRSLSYIVTYKTNIRVIFHLLIIIFIGTSIPVNIRFLNNQYGYWETASGITKTVIHDTSSYLPEKDQYKDIYYVNLPDGIYWHDFGWPDAYVFRNGIFEAIKLAYPGLNIGMVTACRTENPKGVVTWSGHKLMTPEQLRRLISDERSIALIYDARIKTIRKLTYSDDCS